MDNRPKPGEPESSDLEALAPTGVEGESPEVTHGRDAVFATFLQGLKGDTRFDEQTRDPMVAGTMRRYLVALVSENYYSRACARVGISFMRVVHWRKKHSWFVEWEQHARELGVEVLEAEVDRRAFSGYDKPVWYAGKQVGTERVFSDTLALARLKALAPDRYSERRRPEPSVPDGGPLKVQPIVEVLHQKLLDAAARHQGERRRKEE